MFIKMAYLQKNSSVNLDRNSMDVETGLMWDLCLNETPWFTKVCKLERQQTASKFYSNACQQFEPGFLSLEETTPIQLSDIYENSIDGHYSHILFLWIHNDDKFL